MDDNLGHNALGQKEMTVRLGGWNGLDAQGDEIFSDGMVWERAGWPWPGLDCSIVHATPCKP